MKRFYLLTALFALTAAGCVKVDLVDVSTPPLPENLTVERTDYTLGPIEERTATVVFSAKEEWTLSIVYDNAGNGDETGTAWLTADAAGGAAGEQSVGMSAVRNFQASPRTAYVDLVCGEQSVRLTVTQTGLSDETNFTALFDETFAQKLQERNIVADAENITPDDMEKMAVMAELDISGTYDNPGSLTSLRGIEYFESLTSLNCAYNSLPTLDISRNTKLTELWCRSNQLTSLDVSKNTLTTLSCSYNPLTELDVSQNTELTVLDCQSNQLTKLDVSKNTALTTLDCFSNQLTKLDVSQNTELTELSCSSNKLTTLDVSRNTELTELWCRSTDDVVLLLQSVDGAGCKPKHGIDGVGLPVQSVDGAGCKQQHETDAVVVPGQFVDGVGYKPKHGTDAVALPVQSVDEVGYKQKYEADEVVLRLQSVDEAGCEQKYGADVVVLRLQSVDEAGCEQKYGADVVGLLRQSRGQGVEVPGNGLVRQRDQAGEFIYSQPELDVLRQDHCHRLPDGNGRIAPPFKKGVLWAAGTFQVSDG